MEIDVAGKDTKELKKKRNSLFIIPIILLVVVLFYTFNIVFDGKFLTASNIIGILTHAVIPSFMAWGLAFMFACGYIDLSIGGVIVVAANIASTAANAFGYPGLIIGGVLTGVILIFINFNVFVYSKIPSWIAGLGMAMIYEAIAVFYSKAMMTKSIDLQEQFRALGQVPGIFIVFGIGLVLTFILYNRSTIGLNIRSLGSGTDVAKAMGINVNKTLLAVGIIAGIFIGIAALLQISYTVRISAKTGLTSLLLIFQPLATLLLAQVIQKWINLIIAIPICAVFIHAVFNMLTIANVPSGTWQEAVLGFSVIAIGMAASRNVKGVVK